MCRQFQRKYPYHFEDFVSDHPESTRYVAYNFAKKQAALMYKGVSERDAINSRLFTKKDEKEESLDKKLNEKEQIAYQYMHVNLEVVNYGVARCNAA